ncbi:MAG: glycosyltransferase family 9 protein [Cyanobacteria bacterium J06638_20]
MAMRVLALVPGGTSEQLLFLPTLEHLKQALPQAEISVVVAPAAAAAYRVSKVVQTTIPYNFGFNNSPADWANLLGVVRDREFEVAITTTQNWPIRLLLWLSGVPTRIGYASGSKNSLYLTATVPPKTEQYLAFQYHDLLAPLAIEGACPAPSINVPQGDIGWVDNQVQQLDLGEQGYVLLYPGAAEGGSDDQYSLDGWRAIIQDFQRRQPGLPLVLLQQTETAAAVKELTQTIAGLYTIRPENLGQIAALVAGANLVLATDSYVSQLGVALGVFTLALFGHYTPERRLPPIAGSEQRFLGIKSTTDKVADIPADTILKKVWNEE